MKAIVLYEFNARESDELSICPGDDLTIVNDKFSDGWWVVRNQRLEEGIVPTSYIQVVNSSESEENLKDAVEQENWDDFDSENSFENEPTPSNQQQSPQDFFNYNENRPCGEVALRPTPNRLDDNRQSRVISSDVSRLVALRKSIARQFTKNGAEDFLIGTDQLVKVEESTVDGVVQRNSNGEMKWYSSAMPYHCSISSHKKSSKMHGMKSYVSYFIVPSFSGIQVNRRYKQFDWLYKRLSEKYICVCVPALPDKQITGRFENEFIEERQKQLQSWLNCISEHPVLSQSKVFQHFLTCTDDKKWKIGKREGEKEPFQGMKFFYCIERPVYEVEWTRVSETSQQMDAFVTHFDKSNKLLADRFMSFNQKQSGIISKDYRSIAEGFKELSEALAKEPSNGHDSLCKAVAHTSSVYGQIADLYFKQPRKDGEKLVEQLQDMIRLSACLPPLVNLEKAAINIAQEAQRQSGEMDVAIIQERSSIIVDAISAEFTYQKEQRDPQMRSIMRSYIEEQIQFFDTITNYLSDVLKHYEN